MSLTVFNCCNQRFIQTFISLIVILLLQLFLSVNGHQTYKFVAEGSYTYTTLCVGKNEILSLNDENSLKCLTLALSLLHSETIHPFTILTAKDTVIEDSYMRMIKQLGVKIYYYDKIKLPKQAIALHKKQRKYQWIISYQRVCMFKLPYKKVILLDNDQIIQKNIDELFNYEYPVIARDCGPHSIKIKQFDLNSKIHIASIVLIFPNDTIYELLVDKIKNGVIKNEHGEFWRWDVSDQSILPQLIQFQLLDCKYQITPDTCFWAPEPLKGVFDLSNYYIFHFTWVQHKSSQFLQRGLYYYYLKMYKLQTKSNTERVYFYDEDFETATAECWHIFASSIHFYLRVLSLLREGSTAQGSMLTVASAFSSAKSLPPLVLNHTPPKWAITRNMTRFFNNSYLPRIALFPASPAAPSLSP